MTDATPTPALIGILTVSDRASRGEYADESGPAILDYLRQVDPLPRTVRQFQKRRDAILQSFAALSEMPTQDQLATMLGLPERKFVQLSRMVRAAETIRFEDLSESTRRKVA